MNRNVHCLLVPSQKHTPNPFSDLSASLFTAPPFLCTFSVVVFFFFSFQVADKKMKSSEAKNKSLKAPVKFFLFDADSTVSG